MGRETGYYWVKDNNVPNPEWRVAKWDGSRFYRLFTGWTISGHHLDIDECRIVRDETKRGVRKSEKARRNLHITSAVLGGDRMTDVAKLHGITPTCVRYIVHRTLKRRNPALFKSLASFRPGQATPSIGDLATHAAEFGFSVQPDGTVDTSKEG